MESLLSILISQDGMTQEEAENEITMARNDLHERLAEGKMPHDICEEWFGLEPPIIYSI